ncbi:MAG: tetratricopeptide repeat protein [Desulfobacteraceae bacterium]|nr:tetratricopeptide repeat protein [Desulfobacteraceae bacterium]
MKTIEEDRSYESSFRALTISHRDSNEVNHLKNLRRGRQSNEKPKASSQEQELTLDNINKLNKNSRLVFSNKNWRWTEPDTDPSETHSSADSTAGSENGCFSDGPNYKDLKKIGRYQYTAERNEEAVNIFKQENEKLGTYIVEALTSIYNYEQTDLDQFKKDTALKVVGTSAGVVALGLTGFGTVGIILLVGMTAYKVTDQAVTGVNLKSKINKTNQHMSNVADLLLDKDLTMLDPNDPNNNFYYKYYSQMFLESDEERKNAEDLKNELLNNNKCDQKTVNKLFENKPDNLFDAKIEPEQKNNEEECKEDVYKDDRSQSNELDKARGRHIVAKANRLIESKKFILSGESVEKITETLNHRREEIKKKLSKTVKGNRNPFKGTHYRNIGVDATTLLYHACTLAFESSSPESAVIKIGTSAAQTAFDVGKKNKALKNRSDLENVRMPNNSENIQRAPTVWSKMPSTMASTAMEPSHAINCLQRYKPLVKRMAKFNATPKDLAKTFNVNETIILSFCRENNICAVNKYMFHEWTTDDTQNSLISKENSVKIWTFLHKSSKKLDIFRKNKTYVPTVIFENGKMTRKFWNRLNSAEHGNEKADKLVDTLKAEVNLDQQQAMTVVDLLRTFPEPMTDDEIKGVKNVCNNLQVVHTTRRRDAADQLVRDMKDKMDLDFKPKRILKSLESNLSKINPTEHHDKMYEIVVQLSKKNTKDKNGNRPLHVAAMTANETMIREIMTVRMDKFDKYLWSDSIKNKYGQTPLQLALDKALIENDETSLKTFVELKRTHRPNGYEEKYGQTIAHYVKERGKFMCHIFNYNDAIKYYEFAIELNPELSETINPEIAFAYYNLGSAKEKLGNRKDAITNYTEAIRLNPKLAESINPNLADEFFDRGLAKHKENVVQAKAYNNSGLSEFYKGYYEVAIKFFEKAIKLDSESADALKNLDLAKRKNNEVQARACCNLGNTQFDKKNYDEAIDYYTNAIRLNPKYAEALKYLELAKRKKNEVQARTCNDRGLSEFHKGNYEVAIKFFDKAIKLDSESADALKNLELAKRKKNEVQAKAKAKAYNSSGLAELRKGNYENALKFFEKAIELDSESADALKNLKLAKRKKKEDAVNFSKQIYKVDAKWLKKFSDAGGDVNMVDKNGVTLIDRAATYGLVNIVKLLIEHPDIKVNKTNREDQTPLFGAARFGHTDVVKLLLSHPKIDIKEAREHLDKLVQNDDMDSIQEIVLNGCSKKVYEYLYTKAIEANKPQLIEGLSYKTNNKTDVYKQAQNDFDEGNYF